MKNNNKWTISQWQARRTLLKYKDNISYYKFRTLYGMIAEGREREALKGLWKILIRNQKEVSAKNGQNAVPTKAAKAKRETA